MDTVYKNIHIIKEKKKKNRIFFLSAKRYLSLEPLAILAASSQPFTAPVSIDVATKVISETGAQTLSNNTLGKQLTKRPRSSQCSQIRNERKKRNPRSSNLHLSANGDFFRIDVLKVHPWKALFDQHGRRRELAEALINWRHQAKPLARLFATFFSSISSSFSLFLPSLFYVYTFFFARWLSFLFFVPFFPFFSATATELLLLFHCYAAPCLFSLFPFSSISSFVYSLV